MDKKWTEVLNFIELGRKLDISSHALGMSTLLRDVLKKQVDNVDAAVHDCTASGNVKDRKSIDAVLEFLKQKGGKLIYQLHHENYGSFIFLWDNSIVGFEFSGKQYMELNVQSLDKEFVFELQNLVNPLFITEIEQGHIFAIMSNNGHLSLTSMGNAGISIVRRNYTPEVMEGYDYVVKDLRASSPSGRISIIEGEPGTGKTHLVRAFLMDVPDAMFVLVSPEMVSQLDGPQLLPLLLSHRRNQEGPIILVLEDADKCLVVRQGDNINSIQSLLNLGDGILGSLLDIRIIATTNAKKLEMEPALMRPGRLSRRLEVGALDLKTAKNVFLNLCPAVEFPESLREKKKATLAEVYIAARNAGWEPPVRKNEEDDEADPRGSYYDDMDDDE
jgi:hypothetical protein